ncbi:3-deoxy-7-phosphoheptulonate synthase [Fuchsiella alkaliacetigena]|uniref:3-deoxy-7-phosphoheptulonate synthase n=1 Tax=Fuchsiella alkaliacetigena TaxID=957042 RepID=UPI00200A190E|nr:3-deoxy-7-phosphoheptulonate synthase [Fuchsiella alkaliacetigena]MCK8825893.1 3-deoxy-7-phosphoheptulonate synthase [Fuchsiella alkaliacetigena]
MSQPAKELYPLAGKRKGLKRSTVQIGRVEVGKKSPVTVVSLEIVEDKEQLINTARTIKEAGGEILIGGVAKSLDSPYTGPDLSKQSLELLAQIREATDLAVGIEVMDPRHIHLAVEYVDLIEVAAPNMQNYPLLKALGQAEVSVLLKRGMSATIKEWLLAAEYILEAGNRQVVLCERGVRSFQEGSENILDISAVPTVKNLSHLPIIVEPSDAVSQQELITPLAKAGIVAGGDGVLVNLAGPASSTGVEALSCADLQELVGELNLLTELFMKRREVKDVLS